MSDSLDFAIQRAASAFGNKVQYWREQFSTKALLDGWPYQALSWVHYTLDHASVLMCGDTALAMVKVDWFAENAPEIKAHWIGPRLQPDTVIEA